MHVNFRHLRRKRSTERGAVIVMVAVWLPVLALFTSFAVDFGHFFDYSRNLQNRADAAALAAGNALGGACFGSYTTTETNPIGQAAQQYAGPPVQDASSPYTVPNNMPFPYTTFAPAQYQNVPNLTMGTAPNYHLLLNSTQNWDSSGTDWSMGSDPAHRLNSTAICSSTDEDGNTGAMIDVRITQSNLGLFFPLLGITPTISAHARVTLQGVAGENNIIPLAVRDPAEERCVEANFYSTADTNNPIATAVLQKKGTDPNTGDVQWDNASAPVSVTMPAAGTNVYEQIVTGYCDANPSTYDSTSGLLSINSYPTGTAGSGQAPVIASGGVNLTAPPACTADKLSNQYFSDQPTCNVGVTAHVSFAPNIPYGNESITATDTSGNGGPALTTFTKLNTQVSGNKNQTQTVSAGGSLQVASTAGFAASGSIDDNGQGGTGTVASFAYSAIIDGTHFRLTNGGTFPGTDVITQTGDTTWTSSGTFAINSASGRHPISISATQKSGSIGGNSCSNGQGCTTPFGVQQQAFGACDDGNATLTCNNPPDDSGPIVLSQLRLGSDSGGAWASDPAQVYGRNAFAGGSTQQLVATVELAGLSNAKPADPPTMLRFAENGPNIDHATGLIDCGQGQSKPGSISAIIAGCPTVGSPDCPNNEFTSCAPLAINERPVTNNTPCNPEGNDLSGTVVARTAANPMVPVDCTGTAAGNMPPVIKGLACRILIAGCDDQGKPNGTVCSSNNWSKTVGAVSIPGGDPRALTLVITAPSDLAKNNSGQIIPIENFAVFYVTGWTTNGNGNGNNNPGCNSYAAPPPGAAADAENVNNCPDGSLPNGNGNGNGNNCANVASGEVWGFWMKYTDPNAIPLPTLCNVNAFGNCTPALTR